LTAAGVRAGVGIAPILPGLSDRPELLADVVRAARDAGAAHIWAKLLYLQPGTREHFLDNLARDWPEQLPLYQQLYRTSAYLGHADTKPVLDQVEALRRELGVGPARFRRADPRRREDGSALVTDTAMTGAGPATPAQLALAL
jgi:DNA repair photolyase